MPLLYLLITITAHAIKQLAFNYIAGDNTSNGVEQKPVNK